jgi:hypothetical protein
MKYNIIVPYRNREEHLKSFIDAYSNIINDIDCNVLFVHQKDERPFNRGALLNAGFLEFMKDRSDGIMVFHDVDVFPKYWGALNFDVEKGVVGHPCMQHGNFSLGGVSCFWAEEYIKLNGYPNYWGWGMEDVTLYKRCIDNGIKIDESNSVIVGIGNYNSDKLIRSDHARDPKQMDYCINNGKLFDEEQHTTNIKNGLSNLKYDILSENELAPKMKMIDVLVDVQ